MYYVSINHSWFGKGPPAGPWVQLSSPSSPYGWHLVASSGPTSRPQSSLPDEPRTNGNSFRLETGAGFLQTTYQLQQAYLSTHEVGGHEVRILVQGRATEASAKDTDRAQDKARTNLDKIRKLVALTDGPGFSLSTRARPDGNDTDD